MRECPIPQERERLRGEREGSKKIRSLVKAAYRPHNKATYWCCDALENLSNHPSIIL